MALTHIKDGVEFIILRPVMVDALMTLAIVFHLAQAVLVVTAGTDGLHSFGSLHYRGYAVDLRSNSIPIEKQAGLLDSIKTALGSRFDCILEGDHYHVEYDPQHDGGKSL